jgi:hypothetical protein
MAGPAQERLAGLGGMQMRGLLRPMAKRHAALG